MEDLGQEAGGQQGQAGDQEQGGEQEAGVVTTQPPQAHSGHHPTVICFDRGHLHHIFMKFKNSL